MLNFHSLSQIRLGQKLLTLLCILCFSTTLSAQEKNNNFLKRAKLSYSAISADLVELNRIYDYQGDLIKLAQEDPAGASNFIRSIVGCAQRESVIKLCENLTQSYLNNKEVFK